jgi:hypothetical protein
MNLMYTKEIDSIKTASRSLMQRAFCAPPTNRDNALVEVTHPAFKPEVGTSDFIRVDFTKNSVFCDGLYILTYGGDDPDWIGIRRFQIVPGGLRIYENRQDVPFRELTAEEAADIRIIGWIKDVYKRH